MNLDDLNKIVNDNSLNFINNLILSNYEIDVLDKYNIDYKKCLDMKELIFMLDNYVLNSDNLEIEEILMTISERDYYKNTNK